MLDLENKSRESSIVIRGLRNQLKKLSKAKQGLSFEEVLDLFLDSMEANPRFKTDLIEFNIFRKWCLSNSKRLFNI
jgi:hypothetical protein